MWSADWYIAGPMTGLPENNYPAFNYAEEELTGLGYSVENPAWNSLGEGDHWIGYMRLGLAQLLKCRGIYMLDGWQDSRGARIELNTAIDLKMAVWFENEAVLPAKRCFDRWTEPYRDRSVFSAN